jgi:hypothetical protein
MKQRISNVGTILVLVAFIAFSSLACNKREKIVSASAQYEPPVRTSTRASRAPMGEAAVVEAAQKAFADLPSDLVQFNPSPTLKIHDRVRMEARIARTFIENLDEVLKRKGLKADALVGARISGDQFEFHVMGPEDQMVGSQEFNVWSWDVTPLALGEQVLRLNITLRVVTSEGTQYRALPVIERTVQVVPKEKGAFLGFLQDWWAWILGFVLIAGIAAILIIEPAKKKG